MVAVFHQVGLQHAVELMAVDRVVGPPHQAALLALLVVGLLSGQRSRRCRWLSCRPAVAPLHAVAL